VAPAYAADQQPSAEQQAADTAARIAAATSPLSIPDFAGGWWHHGFSLGVNADGSAEASWRVYAWCKDNGNKQPCDGMNGNYILNGGRATLIFDRADYRTLYGTVTTSTDEKTLPLGPVALTEYDYGLGELVTAPGLKIPSAQRSMGNAHLLGGPRYDSAPDWLKRTYPIGA